MTTLLVAVIVAAVIAAGLLLLVGLCRAAADVRDVEPDTGEYHD